MGRTPGHHSPIERKGSMLDQLSDWTVYGETSQRDRVRAGDLVFVVSEEDQFTCVVDDVRLLPPAEVFGVHSTEAATVTLLKPNGDWLGDFRIRSSVQA